MRARKKQLLLIILTSVQSLLVYHWCYENAVAPNGVAQRPGHRPVNQRVVRFPARARAWVVGQAPLLGVCKRQPTDVSLKHRCFSPSLSPSLPLSLKINK